MINRQNKLSQNFPHMKKSNMKVLHISHQIYILNCILNIFISFISNKDCKYYICDRVIANKDWKIHIFICVNEDFFHQC